TVAIARQVAVVFGDRTRHDRWFELEIGQGANVDFTVTEARLPRAGSADEILCEGERLGMVDGVNQRAVKEAATWRQRRIERGGIAALHVVHTDEEDRERRPERDHEVAQEDEMTISRLAVETGVVDPCGRLAGEDPARQLVRPGLPVREKQTLRGASADGQDAETRCFLSQIGPRLRSAEPERILRVGEALVRLGPSAAWF